jgi:hypothetical protein
MRAPGRRFLVQRPVRPVGVVVIDVLTKDQPQMPFACDQHPVQALVAGAGDPPLGDSVRPGRPGVLMIHVPAAVRTASNAAVNLASRSRIRNLKLLA